MAEFSFTGMLDYVFDIREEVSEVVSVKPVEDEFTRIKLVSPGVYRNITPMGEFALDDKDKAVLQNLQRLVSQMTKEVVKNS